MIPALRLIGLGQELAQVREAEALTEGKVCVVAGFQGVSQDSKDVTTLGRGGSDTTAVALAAGLTLACLATMAALLVSRALVLSSALDQV